MLLLIVFLSRCLPWLGRRKGRRNLCPVFVFISFSFSFSIFSIFFFFFLFFFFFKSFAFPSSLLMPSLSQTLISLILFLFFLILSFRMPNTTLTLKNGGIFPNNENLIVVEMGMVVLFLLSSLIPSFPLPSHPFPSDHPFPFLPISSPFSSLPIPSYPFPSLPISSLSFSSPPFPAHPCPSSHLFSSLPISSLPIPSYPFLLRFLSFLFNFLIGVVSENLGWELPLPSMPM